MRRNRSRRKVRSGRDVHTGGGDERVGGEGGAGEGLCMAQCRNHRMRLKLFPCFYEKQVTLNCLANYTSSMNYCPHSCNLLHEMVLESLQQSTCRPLISLLSSVSKKHIYNFIFAYVQTFYPLSPNQWGFLPGSSALLTATDEWHKILEQ